MRMSGVEEIVFWASSRVRGRDIGDVLVDEDEVAALRGIMRRALL